MEARPPPEAVQNVGHLSRRSAALIGGRLTTLRSLRGVTVKEFAAGIGISTSTAHELLGGRKDPSLGELVRAAHVLGVHSVEELIAPFGTSELIRNEFGADAAP